MAHPVVRRGFGIVAGILAAGLVVAVLESLGHLMFPPPPGLDLAEPADQARLMAVVPLGAKLAVVAAWFLGALAGAWIALRMARWSAAVWVVGAIMAAFSLATTQMFPHPWWMVAAALLLPLLAAWLVRARPSAA